MDADANSLSSFQKSSLKVADEEVGSLLREGDSQRATPQPRRNFKPLSVGLVLLALSIGLILGAFFSQQPPQTEDAQEVIASPTEAKSHHKAKGAATVCEDGRYSKRTLKLAYELPFASLFQDNKGQKKYEASSVVLSEDGYVYAVCDSSWSLSKFNKQLVPFAEDNIQVGNPLREGEGDSGYEALFIDDGSFYVVRESIQHSDETYHAIIEKLSVGEDDYDVEEACSAEFEFEGASKGFEGAIDVRDLNNELVVLGLCEGNHCSEANKNDIGHGRLVAMRRKVLSDGTCQWATIRTIDIPSSAAFRDYSAITLDKASGRVAISSQEDSQLWVGQLEGKTKTGLWDIDNMEFDEHVGKLFDFPKNDSCETIYCNIEGVHWVNSDMIVAVSDKMKSRGKQDFKCFDKDESIHVFVLP